MYRWNSDGIFGTSGGEDRSTALSTDRSDGAFPLLVWISTCGTSPLKWLDHRSRFADLYVFAWHPVTDAALVDHRTTEQWDFFVLRTTVLPQAQGTIGPTTLGASTRPVSAIPFAEGCGACAVNSDEKLRSCDLLIFDG